MALTATALYERLGSFSFSASSHFAFHRGQEVLEQDSAWSLSWDSAGNYHVTSTTPGHSVDYFLVDGISYVRLDTGQMRRRPYQGPLTSEWPERAIASQRQVLDLFFGFLTMVETPSDGPTRYDLRLKADGERMPELIPEDSPLAVATTPLWREQAQPLAVKGALWVDQAVGYVQRLELEGRLSVADRPVRPTELLLSYRSSLGQVGAVPAIEAPESIEEFHLDSQATTDLSFWNRGQD